MSVLALASCGMPPVRGASAVFLSALVALLSSCSSASDGSQSACQTLCAKIDACCSDASDCEGVPDDLDNCEIQCEEELDKSARVLQEVQSKKFLECVDAEASALVSASCDDINERKDCFEDAVQDLNCKDPGRTEYAEKVCRIDECSEQQQTQCLEQLMPILEDEVPCLTTEGLEEAVLCEFTCTSSSTDDPVQIAQDSSEWQCSYPG